MKNITEFLFEASNSPELKKLLDELTNYEFKPEMKGWEFKKSSYKAAKKSSGEFKITMKENQEFLNGKDWRQGARSTDLYVYLKGFEFEGKQYISFVFKAYDSWSGGEIDDGSFCVLNSMEGIMPFFYWCLKPHRHKTNSDIGPDGELRIWYDRMPKHYTPDIKPYICDKRLVAKMGDLVKIKCVE